MSEGFSVAPDVAFVKLSDSTLLDVCLAKVAPVPRQEMNSVEVRLPGSPVGLFVKLDGQVVNAEGLCDAVDKFRMLLQDQLSRGLAGVVVPQGGPVVPVGLEPELKEPGPWLGDN